MCSEQAFSSFREPFPRGEHPKNLPVSSAVFAASVGWDEGDKSRATAEKGKALMPSLFCHDLQLGTLAQEATIPTLGSTSGLTASKMGSLAQARGAGREKLLKVLQ